MFFANGEQVDGFIISSTTIPPIHSDDELNAMNEKKYHQGKVHLNGFGFYDFATVSEM